MALAGLLAALPGAGEVRAQESIRLSLAGADAAEARHKAASTLGYYNLKLGPAALRFGSSLGVEFNDNVNNTATNLEGDVSFRPSISTQLLWPLTDQNGLTLNIGAGYSFYVKHPNLDQLFLTPGSELSFDIYAGDFWINLHDRFSITENSYTDPTVVGTGDYSQFQNALGTTVTWDLNKFVVKAGYDHVTYIALSTAQNQPDGQSEVFSASGGYALKPGELVGVELGGALLRYATVVTNSFYADADQWNAGAFYETQVSQYLKLRGSAGYTAYLPTSSGQGSSATNFSGVYGQLGLSHRVNQYVDYTLSGGRSINLGFYGGTIDMYSARWAATWRVIRDIGIGTSFTYEHGTELYSGGETFDRYGPGVSLNRAITTKLSGNLAYQFYNRASNLPSRSYVLNIVTLTLSYQF